MLAKWCNNIEATIFKQLRNIHRETIQRERTAFNGYLGHEVSNGRVLLFQEQFDLLIDKWLRQYEQGEVKFYFQRKFQSLDLP